MAFGDRRVVEAIEEGKIVRVSEDYARREGLPIIRMGVSGDQSQVSVVQASEEGSQSAITGKIHKAEAVRGKRVLLEEYRKPLDWEKNKVVQDLVENFHWIVARERKRRNMNRKQLAHALGVSEEVVKRVEFGILPADDFVLVNKIQDYFHINIRKDKQDFTESFRAKIESSAEASDAEDSEDSGGEDDELGLLDDELED